MAARIRASLRMASRAIRSAADGDEPRLFDVPGVDALVEDPGLGDLLADWRASSSGVRYRTPRSPEYLIWRYRDIPGFHYHGLSTDDDLAAAVVCRARVRRGFREVTITELLMRDRSDSMIRATGLLHELSDRTDADYLAASAPVGSRERHVLRRAGFRSVPAVGPLATVRRLNEIDGVPSPLRLDHWNLSLGDVEIF